jgi:thiamine pyrophosphate-dependent acetolactate synthase large subunit-like protein
MPHEALMSRADALKHIVAAYPDEPLIVNVGATIRELASLGRSPRHLYVLDSMGLPPAIGLGLSLALAKTNVEKCVTLEGDGGMLMGLSSLATIGYLKPTKLLLIVLDNGCYASTGSQATAAPTVDFTAVARGCGIQAHRVETEDALCATLRAARSTQEPLLLHVPISQRNLKVRYVLDDPAILAEQFRSAMQEARNGSSV